MSYLSIFFFSFFQGTTISKERENICDAHALVCNIMTCALSLFVCVWMCALVGLVGMLFLVFVCVHVVFRFYPILTQ